MTHVSFERQGDGTVRRVEVPDDRASLPSAYDRRLIAQRTAAPAVPVETPADIEGRARMERERNAAIAAIPIEPVAEFPHASSERRGDKLVTRRTRRDGTFVEFETATPPARPVEPFAPTGFTEGAHGRVGGFDERLRRQRAGQPFTANPIPYLHSTEKLSW